MSREHRKHPRLFTFDQFEIQAKFQHKGQSYTSKVVSLSQGGAFLGLPNTDLTWFSTDDKITGMTFSLPGQDIVILDVEARIVHVLNTRGAAGQHGGFGLAFSKIDTSQAKDIATFVIENIEQPA